MALRALLLRAAFAFRFNTTSYATLEKKFWESETRPGYDAAANPLQEEYSRKGAETQRTTKGSNGLLCAFAPRRDDFSPTGRRKSMRRVILACTAFEQ